MGLLAAREAIASCEADSGPPLCLNDAALIVGTSKGPVEKWLTSGMICGPSGSYGLAQIADDVARELGHSGPRLTTSAACASGLHALIRGVMMIESGEVNCALVIAAEASVHPLFVASFQKLGVLPPEGFGCRPFDQFRAGFLMSEAAAAVVLQPTSALPGRETRLSGLHAHVAQPPSAVGRAKLDVSFCLAAENTAEGGCATNNGLQPASESQNSIAIDQFAIAADATHLTGMDPHGQVLQAVLKRLVDNCPVDLLHAHGTGTIANDPIELDALQSCIVLSDELPIVYSHKAALGHSLGAAGLVSVVLNVMSHRHGIVPPNIQTTNPIPTRNVSISNRICRRPIRRSMAVAAGFGGAIAGVTLK